MPAGRYLLLSASKYSINIKLRPVKTKTAFKIYTDVKAASISSCMKEFNNKAKYKNH